jgi:hypothetical protein
MFNVGSDYSRPLKGQTRFVIRYDNYRTIPVLAFFSPLDALSQTDGKISRFRPMSD